MRLVTQSNSDASKLLKCDFIPDVPVDDRGSGSKRRQKSFIDGSNNSPEDGKAFARTGDLSLPGLAHIRDQPYTDTRMNGKAASLQCDGELPTIFKSPRNSYNANIK